MGNNSHQQCKKNLCYFCLLHTKGQLKDHLEVHWLQSQCFKLAQGGSQQCPPPHPFCPSPSLGTPGRSSGNWSNTTCSTWYHQCTQSRCDLWPLLHAHVLADTVEQELDQPVVPLQRQQPRRVLHLPRLLGGGRGRQEDCREVASRVRQLLCFNNPPSPTGIPT